MTAEGLKAIKVLSAEGIPTNCTLDFQCQPGIAGHPRGGSLRQPLPGPS